MYFILLTRDNETDIAYLKEPLFFSIKIVYKYKSLLYGNIKKKYTSDDTRILLFYYRTRPSDLQPMIRPWSSRIDSFGINTSSLSGHRCATKDETIYISLSLGSGSPSTSPNTVRVIGIEPIPPHTSVRVETLASEPDGSIISLSPLGRMKVIVCGVKLIIFIFFPFCVLKSLST